MTPILSSLTTQDKIKLVAELDGFEQRTTAIWVNKDESKKFWYFFNQRGEVELSNDTPRYDTSYDAIIPLVQKQSEEVRHTLRDYLIGVMIGEALDLYDATPSQLLDALLVATGKATI